MVSQGGPQPDSREAWIVAFASSVLIMVGLGATLLLAVSLKQIAADFAWPRSIPSQAYALCLLGEGMGGILMGLWSERRGMGPVIVLGALSIGGGLLLVSAMDAPWQMYLSYGLLIGLFGVSTLFSPLIANTTRWFVRRRGLAVALVASGQSVSGAVWPHLFRYSNETHGWPTTYMWFGMFSLLAMLALGMVVKRAPPGSGPVVRSDAQRQDVSGARVLGLDPNLVLFALFLAIVCCCGAMATPLVHLVSHVSDVGHPMTRAAELLSVALAVSFTSRFVLGALSDRIGGLKTLLLGSGLQAVSLLLFAEVHSLTGLFIVAIVFGLGFGGIVPSYPVIIRELFPAHGIGWRIPSVLMGGAIGMAVGGWAGGHIFDMTGSYHMAFYLGLAFNIGNLAIVGTLFARWRRRGGFTRAAVPA